MRMFIIYLIAFLLLCFSSKSDAMEYDVDWPSSANGVHVLRITINNCTTLFKVKDKDFDSFMKDKAYYDALKTAIEREKNGCK